jgi:hypothetical protein
MNDTRIRQVGGRLRLEHTPAAQERAQARRVLLQYDPAGIAASLAAAGSLDDLRAAAAQLAHLVEVLAAVMR